MVLSFSHVLTRRIFSIFSSQVDSATGKLTGPHCLAQHLSKSNQPVILISWGSPLIAVLIQCPGLISPQGQRGAKAVVPTQHRYQRRCNTFSSQANLQLCCIFYVYESLKDMSVSMVRVSILWNLRSELWWHYYVWCWEQLWKTKKIPCLGCSRYHN